MNDSATHDPIRLAPIPLVSGNAATDASGDLQQVTGVTVVVTLSTGEERRIELHQKFGGWWAPDDGAVAD